jgi:hypothetical protein
MESMNKIVHEHLSASKLPEKLRQGIDASATVTVIVEEEADTKRPSRHHLRELLHEARKDARGVTTEEAVARIRALRDEWYD